jgi:anti-sigma factor ChrR (cupin superfamily)
MSRAIPCVASILVSAALTAAGAAAAAEMHQIVTPESIKWQAAPPGLPPGSSIAVLSGDPSKGGVFILRAKLPAGYTIPPHWHSAIENVTVLSGALHMGMGDTFNRAKAHVISAGAFVSLPEKSRHYVWTDAETIIQVTATGPFDINYVNPKDDPRTGATATR